MMKRFEGTFRPPAVGSKIVPIKIAGPGHLGIGEGGLVASGFSPSGMTRKKVLILVGLAVLLIGLLLISAFVFPDLPRWVMGAITVGGIAGLVAVARGGSDHSDEQIDMTFPWEFVKTAVWDSKDPSLLLINIKSPKGALFFSPRDSIQLMLQLRSYGVKTPR